MNFKVVLAAAALLATQSFAIIGIGGHYAPGFGTKMKAGEFAPVTEGIEFGHDGFSGGMQGFGFKLWIDILPIFDIEATYNIQFGSYDAALYVDGVADPIPIEIELAGTPFGKANPKFVASNLDISITYPITFIPIIRPYIGGGFTYYLNTFVLIWSGALPTRKVLTPRPSSRRPRSSRPSERPSSSVCRTRPQTKA